MLFDTSCTVVLCTWWNNKRVRILPAVNVSLRISPKPRIGDGLMINDKDTHGSEEGVV